ncbi:R8 protein [Pleurotus ostreatus]|nr:R8 protein [Pleurotus ostreatus]
MFFTTELLEKRDGGFGLLWLAATLGSKSTLKKLPRRDVLTADISQLCDLIMQPAEPLALRLTSNLMVGVARVYKVKQDMFMTDVTTCFNSLKKIVHELHTATDMQLQMAQPTLKSSLLTLDAVKELAGFDFFVADWDDYLNLRDEDDAPEEDEDFNPSGKKLKLKSKPPASTEYPRTDKHTLQEHHEDFLSKSLDLSFNGSFVGGHIPSSSQIGGPFNIPTDDFFQSDGLDIGAVGDELARELGEGWGASPAKDGFGMRLDLQNDIPFFETGGDFDLGFGDDPFLDGTAALQPLEQGQAASKKRKAPPGCQDDMPPPPTPGREPSPSTSFSRMLLSQDEQQPGPLSDITALNRNQENIPNKMKKPKKTRLLLDARTELTDEELKTARAEYLRGQYALKQELELKKAEKDGMKLVEDTLWGSAPWNPSSFLDRFLAGEFQGSGGGKNWSAPHSPSRRTIPQTTQDSTCSQGTPPL